MTFDPTPVRVTSAALPKDHNVQVPKYIEVCGFIDNFEREKMVVDYDQLL